MLSPITSWVAARTGLHEKLNPESLKIWQEEKLQDVIDYACKNTRFYHNKLHHTHRLEELPFTYPEDIVKDPLAFLAVPQSRVARVTTLSGSGTTLARKRIFFTKTDLERTKDFFAIGMSSLVGSGEKAQILISTQTENSLGNLLRESLSTNGVVAEVAEKLKSAQAAVEASKDAACLIGMPVELLYMSRLAPGLRPRSVLLAADIVVDSVVASIKESWKCDVFTHFGHSEFGFGCAVDCDHHNGLHLRDVDQMVEIIDPLTNQTAKPGVPGEIVLTALSNEAMPLIRYRTGNISRVLETSCRCGSPLHRLGKIEGRITSNVTLANNDIISIHPIDELLFSNFAVRGYDACLVRGSGEIVQLLIDSDEPIDEKSLKEQLPFKIQINIRYGHADPFTHRGKRRITML